MATARTRSPKRTLALLIKSARRIVEALLDMLELLADLPGIGPAKLALYGEEIVAVVTGG